MWLKKETYQKNTATKYAMEERQLPFYHENERRTLNYMPKRSYAVSCPPANFPCSHREYTVSHVKYIHFC